MRIRSLSMAFALFLCVHAAHAQDIRFPGRAYPLPGNNAWTPDSVAADFNGDGILDLVVSGTELSVLLGSGSGAFHPATTHTIAGSVPALAAGDVDGDGDLDLLAVNGGVAAPQLFVLSNNGAGVFAITSSVACGLPDFESNVGVYLEDVDHDGDLDAIALSYPTDHTPSAFRLLRNVGGTFPGPPEIIPSPPIALDPTFFAVVDMDNDGNVDVVAMAKRVFYLSRGSPQGLFAPLESSTVLPPTTKQTRGFIVADVDDDGDQDAVITVEYNDNEGIRDVYVLENCPTCQLAQLQSQKSLGTPVLAADLDEDGDIDLLSTRSTGYSMVFNDGAGSFTSSARSSWPLMSPTPLAVRDFDGDGDTDMAVTVGDMVAIYFRDCDGSIDFGLHPYDAWQAIESPPYVSQTHSSSIGDIDCDGDLDIAMAIHTYWMPLNNWGVVSLYNDGTGGFPTKSGGSTQVVTSNPSLPVIAPDCSLAPTIVYAAYLDVDGDGDVDRISVSAGGVFSVSRNLGTGQFGTPEVYQTGHNSCDLTSADMNADGAVDLVVIGGSQVRIYLNTGSGEFTLAHAYAAGTVPNRCRAADLNNDGYPDVVLTESQSTPRTIRVFLHDGVDGLLGETVYPVFGRSQGLALADFDADGDVDIASITDTYDVIAGQQQGILSILQNNGAGGFGQQVFFAGGTGVDVDAGDLDGDGRIDLVVSSEGLSPSVLFNRSACAASDVGACCTDPSQCALLTEEQCDSIAGTFHGFGVSCSAFLCEPLPTGACCLGPSVCEELVFAECIDALGTYRGDSSTCENGICDPPPAGACCVDFAQCEVLTADQCAAVVGDYLGDDSACTTGLCGEFTGRCCFSCAPAIPASPCPDTTSAPSGHCADISPQLCAALRGVYAGDDTSCAAGPCACAADVNGDLRTTVEDFLVLAAHFDMGGPDCMTRADGDLNCDGAVTIADFLILAGEFGCGN